MEAKTVGKFVAQGAAGSAMGVFVLVLFLVLDHPSGYNFFYLLLLPVFLLVMGLFGAGLGGVISFLEWGLEKRLRLPARAAVGIVVTSLVSAVLSLCQEFAVEWRLLGMSLLTGVWLGLPAALTAGSRFNPLRSVVFGSSRATIFLEFSTRLSFITGFLLRVGSLFGLMESLVFLASLVSWARAYGGIDPVGEKLTGPTVAVLYFAASALVSFTPMRKPLLLALGVLVNAPLAIWTVDPQHFTDRDSEFLRIVAWGFISLSMLFVAGRMISIDYKPNLRPSQ